METITLIAATQRDPSDFSEALEASLKGDVADESLNDLDDYMMELSKTEPGKSIVANAEGAMHEAALDRDESLVVLREMIKFHNHFKQVPEATDTYCRAAMYLYNRRDRAISWDGRGVRL